MLTIKKRFPSEKLYLYGGTAFIAGFAGIMLILVQTNTHIRDFMVATPVSFETSSKSPSTEQPTQTTSTDSSAIVSQEEVFTSPSNPSTPTTAPTETAPQPTPTTPAEEPQPTEPVIPTEPTPDPDPEPTPEEPADPGTGGIIDVILP